MPSPDTLRRAKNVIRTSLKLDEQVTIADDMPLIGGEYDLDSLDILLIVTSIEKDFGIKVNEASMAKSAFKDVGTLTAFIDSCLAASPGAQDAAELPAAPANSQTSPDR